MKAKESQLEVKLLLFAIQKTTSFEKFLAQRFISSPYMASVSCPVSLTLSIVLNLFSSTYIAHLLIKFQQVTNYFSFLKMIPKKSVPEAKDHEDNEQVQ